MDCKNESDTSKNSGNWNQLKIAQTVPEQHTRKALYDSKKLHKTATLGTAHILREVLTLKSLTSIYGMLQVTYGLSTEQHNVFCSRYKIINVLYPKNIIIIRRRRRNNSRR